MKTNTPRYEGRHYDRKEGIRKIISESIDKVHMHNIYSNNILNTDCEKSMLNIGKIQRAFCIG